MSLENLDGEHLTPLRQALANILSSAIGEFTYAQIIDGMPTADVYASDHRYREDYPVMSHEKLCDGIMEKTRAFRSDFDILSLQFEPQLLQAYQNAVPAFTAWKLRLLEVVGIACHNIAVLLYQMDIGVHKHAEWEFWRERKFQMLPEGATRGDRSTCGPDTPFFANLCMEPKRYPNGLADVVGYWAEARIFGGVVLFDRGESELECNGIYIHTAGFNILVPPTEGQFNELLGFLLCLDPNPDRCPLPIEFTEENRWRWHGYEGMVYHHLFKYRHEIPQKRFPGRCVISSIQWPEFDDERTIRCEMEKKEAGEPYDDALIVATQDRLRRTISPTSEEWPWYEDEIVKMQPDKKKQGRPPYFFDP